jgi:hypothetical protein
MSAYIVNHATMQNAVEAILVGEDSSVYGTSSGSKRQDEVQHLGDRLYLLNEQAMNARYGDEVTGQIRFNGKGFDFTVEKTPQNFQRYKSLSSLLYQLSDGDVPKMELYQRAEAARLRLATKLVEDDVLYESAEWSVK